MTTEGTRTSGNQAVCGDNGGSGDVHSRFQPQHSSHQEYGQATYSLSLLISFFLSFFFTVEKFY